MKYPSDSPICIVGAGPGGLGAAFYLRSAGYTNVTVLEKTAQVGGKCHSVVVDGIAYDVGALEVTQSYVHALPLIEKYGLQMTDIGRVRLIDSATGEVHPASYMTASYGLLEKAALAKDVVKYFVELDLTDDSLEGPGFRNVSPELARPLARWLDDKHMSALARLFYLPVTCYGYGPLDQVPAAYVLKYLDETDYSMLIKDVVEDLFGRVGFWPRRILTGYQSLMRHMADDMLSTGTTRILTGADITSVRRHQPGPHPVQVEYLRDGVRSVESFDHLILASLLTADALSFVDLSPGEHALLSQVRVRDYFSTMCEIPGLEVGTYAITVTNGAIVDPLDGSPCMIMKFWENTNLVNVYTYATETLTIPEVEARVTATLAAMKLDLRGIRQTFRWPYFPHVDEAALAAGFYERLTALMGTGNTWYAGGLMNFEDVEKCLEWSAHLVEEHFA